MVTEGDVPTGVRPPSGESAPPTGAVTRASPDPRYAIEHELGRGGMGEVWSARDTRIERDIALKVLRAGRRYDANSAARFMREARVQARLEHPGIVPVHDLGIAADGEPYFVMKRLAGTTVADVLAAHARGDRDALTRWSRRALLARLVDCALAVEFAHARGIIHRDLKPANLMLGDFGEAYVLDWGLARLVDEPAAGPLATADLSAPELAGATAVGAMMGTPGYMAPEQMRGDAIDPRADVYALGCVLFEILTGARANPEGSAVESTLESSCHRPSARAPDAEVPPELEELCARATAAEPDRRVPSARAFADAIQRYLDGDRDLAARRALADGHARAATTALARSERAAAMREAGRALALDPTHAEAQGLVARLLIEAPATTPPEAARAADAERERIGQSLLRTGGVGYLVFLTVVLVVAGGGYAEGWPLWGLALDQAALAALFLGLGRRPRRIGLPVFALVLLLHCGMLAGLAVILGPLLMVPMMAVGSLSLMQIMPSTRFPVLGLVAHVLAVLVPLALELGGVLPSTFELAAGSLVLHPWAIHASAGALLGVAAVTFVLQLCINSLVIGRLRAHQDAELLRRHVQAWHLAQLVPPTASALPRG